MVLPRARAVLLVISVLVAACGAPVPTPSPDATPTPAARVTEAPTATPSGPSGPPTTSPSPSGLVLPVAEYGRDLGCSVTGGFVYRGRAVGGLAGWYLFGDYCSGFLFGVRSDAPTPAPGERAQSPRVLLETGANISAFGEDADGELYLADLASGAIYRVIAAP